MSEIPESQICSRCLKMTSQLAMKISHRKNDLWDTEYVCLDCWKLQLEDEKDVEELKHYACSCDTKGGKDLTIRNPHCRVHKDNVNHPSHYTQGKIECIEFIEDQKMGYHLGNAIKYIVRAPFKGNAEQDIKKAIWYLNRYLTML